MGASPARILPSSHGGSAMHIENSYPLQTKSRVDQEMVPTGPMVALDKPGNDKYPEDLYRFLQGPAVGTG